MRDMVDNARKIVLTVQIPVFADADTGYGDAISTHFARACAHVREGHDGSTVCGGGRTTSLARAAAMDRRSGGEQLRDGHPGLPALPLCFAVGRHLAASVAHYASM